MADESEQRRLEGNAAFQAGDWDAAIAAYSEALNAWDESAGDKPDKRIYSNRAAAYLKKAADNESSLTYQFALEDAERAVEIDPSWSKAWYRKCCALVGLEKIDEATAAYTEGLAHCPGDPDLVQGLQECLEAKPSSSSAAKTNGAAPKQEELAGPRKVVDTSLYDALGVEPSAPDGIIKKAYYHLAKECHPDKNPDDPDATAKFQKIGEAYQVLSNPDTRKLYDEQGLEGLKQADFEAVDPSQLFAMLFGSDQFERYIGELQMTSQMSMIDEEGNPPDQETTKRIQQERETKLVRELLEIIQPWIDGKKTAFETWAREEVQRLKETNFGPVLLYTVGFVYHRKSVIELGKSRMGGIPALVNTVKYNTAKFGTQVNAVYSASKVMQQQKKMQTAEGEESLTEEEKTKMTMSLAESALSLMWSFSAVDIQATVDAVCERVLTGEGLSQDTSPNTSRRKGAKEKNVLDAVGSFVGSFAHLKNKKELSEGYKATSREDLLFARATAIKKLGRIFMENGSESMESVLKADMFQGEPSSDGRVPQSHEAPTAA
eukprot:CAMPEP_0198315766 /NCGR_PEP_ID=MMETSP1450-20131203/5911_1 /TAXON_ID=753684 ORGANISM="Madagascaria erythrocladiodes, Strain CCMP3234" /NCGR_SAMPLE_ID=MMETSP1450 /ASSEMBLY_ACC=CAM_ASM_001115 /LENGTH=547 /DNA_ID=CAMNT_0044018891 /DNA_START=11 /DNA_END=1654 /DNA_ORIENTATION=+